MKPLRDCQISCILRALAPASGKSRTASELKLPATLSDLEITPSLSHESRARYPPFRLDPAGERGTRRLKRAGRASRVCASTTLRNQMQENALPVQSVPRMCFLVFDFAVHSVGVHYHNHEGVEQTGQ
eukprot:2269697-Rhodomonas_salina.2